MTFFTALVFALGVTLPNILLLCLGKVLRIKKRFLTNFVVKHRTLGVCARVGDFVWLGV